MKHLKKLAPLALCLGLGLGSTSCLGPDTLYSGIKNWNAEISEQDWINETLFIGMHILPVYQLALFGDIVIFNTIEYWSGDSVFKQPEPFPGFHRGK